MFHPSLARFSTIFKKIVVEVKASRSPLIVKLMISGKQGHAHYENVCFGNSSVMAAKFYGADGTFT